MYSWVNNIAYIYINYFSSSWRGCHGLIVTSIDKEGRTVKRHCCMSYTFLPRLNHPFCMLAVFNILLKYFSHVLKFMFEHICQYSQNKN